MMKLKVTSLALLGMMYVAPVFAAIQTVTLSVPGMFCPSCPFIIQAAIGDVDGVQNVDTDLETRTAVVTYDDKLTTIDDIMFATAVVGYEAFLIEEGAGS